MSKQKISVLPNHIINQIAAGEVVERPASVLKELLDNSIDAGATQIKVYIEEGGTKGIKVVDNGCGMIAEDAETAFLPHSTSKIKDEKDLENILTLGFRGEALASISSVSKVELITKTKDSLSGFRVFMEGGEIKEKGDIGAIEGTNIHIQEIFFNTPARKKFLKTTATELRHIIKMFTELTLAKPEIGFELHHNGKQLFALPGIKSNENNSQFPAKSTINALKERIRNLIGNDFAQNSFEIYYDGIIKISGFGGLPKLATSRKSTQIIIVNGRPVTNSTIIAAVKDAYHTAIPKHLHPQFVINITVDPKKVDVNVHPRKLEIRFENQQEIFRAVKYSIKANLEKALQQDTEEKLTAYNNFTTLPKSENLQSEMNSGDKSISSTKYKLQTKNIGSVQDSLNFTKSLLKKNDKPLPWEDSPQKKKEIANYDLDTKQLFPAYQFLNAYIITTNGSAIQIVDQHAAAERVTYERLMKNIGTKSYQTQSLLVPFELDLNPQEVLILIENTEYLAEFGIIIEEFGSNSLIVREIPVEIKDSDLNAFVKELLNDLIKKEGDEKNSLERMKERILTTMSCHSSIRAGDKMTQEAVNQLIENLRNCDIPYSCPHGRPIIYEIPISELDKKFERT